MPERYEIRALHLAGAGDGFSLYDTDEQAYVGGWFALKLAAVATHGVLHGWFADHGGWKSVDHAAAHVLLVQGGFTTPSIEAHRMLREPANRATAEAWLDEHEPDWRMSEQPGTASG